MSIVAGERDRVNKIVRAASIGALVRRTTWRASRLLLAMRNDCSIWHRSWNPAATLDPAANLSAMLVTKPDFLLIEHAEGGTGKPLDVRHVDRFEDQSLKTAVPHTPFN